MMKESPQNPDSLSARSRGALEADWWKFVDKTLMQSIENYESLDMLKNSYGEK